MGACNLLRTQSLHGVSSGNPHPYVRQSPYGKVRSVPDHSRVCCYKLFFLFLTSHTLPVVSSRGHTPYASGLPRSHSLPRQLRITAIMVTKRGLFVQVLR